MYLPDKIEKVLLTLGYDSSDNIAEYWFAHRNDVSVALRKYFINTEIQKFETQIRWKSLAGIECQKAVRAYIERRVEEIQDEINDAFKKGMYSIPDDMKIIDFNTFTFDFEGNTWSLDDFQEMYASSKIYPAANLMGIDLHGININNCKLINICLANANFEDAKLGSIVLQNCTLNGAILKNARLGQVRFHNSSMTGANVEGAFFNVVDFDNQSTPDGLYYSKVSYLYLIKCLFFSIFRSGILSESPANKRKHTVFLFNDTKKLTSPYNLSFKNYVDWYQYVFVNLRNFKRLLTTEKLLFSLSLVFTKCWTSYGVLASFALFANFSFALIYMLNCEALESFDGKFLTAFYYSVVTFTTLGYGEIHPIEDITRFVVMIEVILGYVTLGSFVFLIGHKVKDRF